MPEAQLPAAQGVDEIPNGPGTARIRRMLDRCEEQIELASDGYGSLSKTVHETIMAGGKRLRPLLVFVCGGESECDDLVRAAAAVETVHTASLIHDDVLDESPRRRGVPTVYASEGTETASAAGDLLFSRAIAEIAENGSSEQVRVLAGACRALAEGELAQRRSAYDFSLTEKEYMSRIALKTASLFEASCELAALAGPLTDARKELSFFGRNVGAAFQIVDDVIDVAGDDRVTGKSRGADLISGTVTLPHILARHEMQEIKGLEPALVRGERVEAVLELITDSSALEQCKAKAENLVEEGLEALGNVSLPDCTRESLEAIAGASIERGS